MLNRMTEGVIQQQSWDKVLSIVLHLYASGCRWSLTQPQPCKIHLATSTRNEAKAPEAIVKSIGVVYATWKIRSVGDAVLVLPQCGWRNCVHYHLWPRQNSSNKIAKGSY